MAGETPKKDEAGGKEDIVAPRSGLKLSKPSEEIQSFDKVFDDYQKAPAEGDGKVAARALLEDKTEELLGNLTTCTEENTRMHDHLNRIKAMAGEESEEFKSAKKEMDSYELEWNESRRKVERMFEKALRSSDPYCCKYFSCNENASVGRHMDIDEQIEQAERDLKMKTSSKYGVHPPDPQQQARRAEIGKLGRVFFLNQYVMSGAVHDRVYHDLVEKHMDKYSGNLSPSDEANLKDKAEDQTLVLLTEFRKNLDIAQNSLAWPEDKEKAADFLVKEVEKYRKPMPELAKARSTYKMSRIEKFMNSVVSEKTLKKIFGVSDSSAGVPHAKKSERKTSGRTNYP